MRVASPPAVTAVGKLLLSDRIQTRDELVALLGEGPEGPLPRRTQRTITGIDALWRELVEIRERGYAVDDQENEAGVNCVAGRTVTVLRGTYGPTADRDDWTD